MVRNSYVLSAIPPPSNLNLIVITLLPLMMWSINCLVGYISWEPIFTLISFPGICVIWLTFTCSSSPVISVLMLSVSILLFMIIISTSFYTFIFLFDCFLLYIDLLFHILYSSLYICFIVEFTFPFKLSVIDQMRISYF